MAITTVIIPERHDNLLLHQTLVEPKLRGNSNDCTFARNCFREVLRGTVIIDVHGVGYEVAVAAHDFDVLQLDDTAKIYTYHHVREQAEVAIWLFKFDGEEIV